MKDIKGYEDYMISKEGDIFSKKSKIFLKQQKCGSGYNSVTLRKDGKSHQRMVHRLVALTYLPNPKNKRTVNHIDGDKTNNSVDNLEWNTHSENIKHSIYVLGNTGHIPPSKKGMFGYQHNRSKEVHLYDDKGYVCSYGSCSEASRNLGCHVSTITLAIKNKSKTRVGYYFSYEKKSNYKECD